MAKSPANWGGNPRSRWDTAKGCDASVLLNSAENNQAERDAIPNTLLRGFNVIDAVKYSLEKNCPGIVSCADVLALAARYVVQMVGGPFWDVPTGRRDGTVSIMAEALAQLPSPLANITKLKQDFAAKGLSAKDLAVLSGGHTIARGHCFVISNRLYNFTGKGDTDPSLDPRYAAQLKMKCKPGDLNTAVEMDPVSFKTFNDDCYTPSLLKEEGFSNLMQPFRNKSLFYTTICDSWSHFFCAESTVKMGSISVLTGNQGEIRKRCAFVN